MVKVVVAFVASGVTLAGMLLPAGAVTGQPQRSLDGIVYRDVGYDPKDEPKWERLDIRMSSRTVFHTSGTRYLRISVRGELDFSEVDWLSVEARLDTRRGPRWDYRLVFSLGDLGSGSPDRCLVAKRGDDLTRTGERLRFNGAGAMRCRLAAAELRITHRVRWRLLSFSEPFPAAYALHDRAPDRGWFPR